MTRRSVCLVPTLFLPNCGKPDIATALKLMVSTAQAILPFLPGLTATTREVVIKYLAQVADATERATAILATTDTAASKAAQITAVFAGIMAPNLPDGTLKSVVDGISAVAKAVRDFLAAVSGAAASRQVVTAGAADKATLEQIGRDARALKAALR